MAPRLFEERYDWWAFGYFAAVMSVFTVLQIFGLDPGMFLGIAFLGFIVGTPLLWWKGKI